MAALNHTRLSLDAFSETARKHVDPQSPPPLRMMGAKAMAPLPPEELVTVLYQLTFDPDAPIRRAAKSSIDELPDEILHAVVGAPLDPVVLDTIARTIVRNDGVLEKLVLNNAVANETIAFLAQRVSEKISEIVAGNHKRLLAYPAIIEAIYQNPNARMSTVDKLLDLAQRNNVRLAGLPGLEDALKNAEYRAEKDSAVSDEAFAAVAREAVSKIDEDVDDEEVDALLQGERDPEDEKDEKRKSKWQMIEAMTPSQKIRLAMIGGKEERAILLRDAKKIIHMAAIQSPKITPGEASKLASNRSLPDGVISYIARKRDWTRFYPVVVSLVNNPKTPLSASVGFLKMLRANDLSALRRNKNVPSQLARQATAMYRKKSGGG